MHWYLIYTLTYDFSDSFHELDASLEESELSGRSISSSNWVD